MILSYLANGIYDAFKNNKIFYYRYIIEYKSYLENHIWYDYILESSITDKKLIYNDRNQNSCL